MAKCFLRRVQERSLVQLCSRTRRWTLCVHGELWTGARQYAKRSVYVCTFYWRVTSELLFFLFIFSIFKFYQIEVDAPHRVEQCGKAFGRTVRFLSSQDRTFWFALCSLLPASKVFNVLYVQMSKRSAADCSRWLQSDQRKRKPEKKNERKLSLDCACWAAIAIHCRSLPFTSVPLLTEALATLCLPVDLYWAANVVIVIEIGANFCWPAALNRRLVYDHSTMAQRPTGSIAMRSQQQYAEKFK